MRDHLDKLAVTTLFFCFIYAGASGVYPPRGYKKPFTEAAKLVAQETSSSKPDQSVAQEKPADKHSTPEDRQRLVAIAHKLEAAPLDPSLAPERQWAVNWTIAAPDLHVRICPALLSDLRRPKYKYKAEMSDQLLISSAAFLIEHSEQADNYRAQNIAGMEGVLRTYAAILKAEPQATAQSLDALLQKQREGKLAEAVSEVVKGCN